MAKKNVVVVDHPLVQHKLTLMRMKDTSTVKFRNLMREVSMLIGYEVTRNSPMTNIEIQTPIASTMAPILERKRTALISILRAGSGIVDGMLQLMPTAKVGHIGLYRDGDGESIVEYYLKFPEDLAQRQALVLDPMLATGHTAVIAVNRLKEASPRKITFVCLLAAPEGLEYFHTYHPEVCVYTAAIDEGLNSNNFIVPGLGDAGDRLFGTK